jgi:hypothetical protein
VTEQILSLLGWLGFAGLMAFYWMIGSGRPIKAYVASSVGAAAFLIIGVAIQMGYQVKLPSLIVMESVIIGLNLRAIYKLRGDR